MRIISGLILSILVLTGSLWAAQAQEGVVVSDTVQSEKPVDAPYATFAGGCFWCLESEFRALDGVLYTRVGYTGGIPDHPDYHDVTTGKTGHAEAVEIYYDPAVLSYRALLDHFLRKAHDPTQLNRQGVDVGTQYRSVIFYHDEAQKAEAEAAIAAAEADKVWKNPIVTELLPAATFWEAEGYHQQYYEKYEEKTGKPHVRVLMKKEKQKN